MRPRLRALASRLTSVLPHGIRVVAIPPAVMVYHGLDGVPAYLDVGDLLARGEDEGAAYNILNGVQDHVIRDIAAPWPVSKAGLAMPHAQRQIEGVRLWYGSESEIALDLGVVQM